MNQTAKRLMNELYLKQRSVRRLKTLALALLVLNLVGLATMLLVADQGRFHF